MANKRDSILMCPPDYFSVDYVINPWMAGQEGAPDLKKTMQQWTALTLEFKKAPNGMFWRGKWCSGPWGKKLLCVAYPSISSNKIFNIISFNIINLIS